MNARRAAGVASLLILAAAMWVLTAPARLGGQVHYVVTTGTSMAPTFQTGDLAVVYRSDTYRVGDVVAYQSRVLDRVVLHRIVGRDGRYFVLKGDSNNYLDPDRPDVDAVLGKLACRVPQGGVWLERVTSPAVIGAVAFVVLAGSGTAVQAGRRRRDKGRRRAGTLPVTVPPQHLRTAAGWTSVVAVGGIALAGFGWSGPVDEIATVGQATDETMVFAYSAEVPRTPAYDGTTVRSPQPVFRKVADALDVHYTYRGAPGRVTVAATISANNKWHTTIPLATATDFSGGTYRGGVTLQLGELEARAQAAAAVIGLPVTQMTVRITPRVTSREGSTFAPHLDLLMDPLQVTLADDPASLRVSRSVATQTKAHRPRSLTVKGHALTAETARTVSAALGIAVVLTAAVLLGLARRSAPATEGDDIRRRYAAMLVPVHPIPTPPGRRLVVVPEFATLAKLAAGYGLLVLHWTADGVETFVVQDEGTTYRYCTAATVDTSPADGVSATTGVRATDGVRAADARGETHGVPVGEPTGEGWGEPLDEAQPPFPSGSWTVH